MEEQQQHQVVLGCGGHARCGFCLQSFFRPRHDQKSFVTWVPIVTVTWNTTRL